VDTVFGNNDKIVPHMKSDDSMIDTVVRTYPGDDNGIPARTKA
jgi:hypothetical protein